MIGAGCTAAYLQLAVPEPNPDLLTVLPFLSQQPGDYGAYLLRFGLSFALLGVLPLGAACACGCRPTHLGLRRTRRLQAPVFVFLIAVFLAAGVISAYFPALRGFYPYSDTLVDRVVEGQWEYLVLHWLLYSCLYYLPWEFLFRGYLVFPFLALLPESKPKDAIPPAAFAVACLQVIPSVLLHSGHPTSEIVSAVLAGVFFGYLALYTRSIIPGLILHALVGMSLDTVIILRATRILP